MQIYTPSLHDALPIFNGMFAISLWDAHKRRLFLARDRVGIKPLYYWADQTKLVFASELKALILHPRSEEHTSELQSPCNIVCRLLLEKKKYYNIGRTV